MKHTSTLVVLLLAFSTAYGQQTLRQKSNTKGFNVSLYAQYAFWNILDNPEFRQVAQINPGLGLGARVGYGFSQRFEAALSADVSVLNHAIYVRNSTIISHLDLTGRVNIGSTTNRLRPFLDVGITGISATSGPVLVGSGPTAYEADFMMDGAGLAVGGGLNYFFKVPLAVTARYMGSFGRFINNRLSTGTVVGAQTNMNTHRASLGVIWYVRGKR